VTEGGCLYWAGFDGAEGEDKKWRMEHAQESKVEGREKTDTLIRLRRGKALYSGRGRRWGEKPVDKLGQAKKFETDTAKQKMVGKRK